MIQLGKWNRLRIVRFTDHGAYLDGHLDEILMPRAYVTEEMRPDDEVDVFVYLDQDERLVATTETPLAEVGQFAFLRVAWVNEFGAFLDWGLMKDLFVPFSQQKRKMEIGEEYLVYVYVDDETQRIVASAKVERFLLPAGTAYYRDREVEVLVQHKTPLGFKVIVDNAHAGLIYDNQIYGMPHSGDRLKGYVVTCREDGRLDISLQKLGKGRFRDFSEQLLDELASAGGFLPFGDHSSPEEIAERFGVSKKTFKRAVGTLYRDCRLRLEDDGIRLNSDEERTAALAETKPYFRKDASAPRKGRNRHALQKISDFSARKPAFRPTSRFSDRNENTRTKSRFVPDSTKNKSINRRREE